MSQRHRSRGVLPPPKMELRAHAHNERHRIHSELHAVASQVSRRVSNRTRCHEPGRAWVPTHHHGCRGAKGRSLKRTAPSATGR